MKAAMRLLSVALLAATYVPAAMAGGHTHFPNSTWTLNVSKSDFGSGPSMKSDIMTIKTDTDKWLTFTDVTVDADGKKWSTSWSGPQDGTWKPLTGMPGGKASFKTDDDSSHFAYPDGTTSDGWMSASDDKKTVTIKVTGKAKDGKEFHQTLVYDRTK